MARPARRPRPAADAHQIAFVALWVPQTAEARLGRRHPGGDGAGPEHGQRPRSWSRATLRAAVLSELGRPHEMRAAARLARAEAARAADPVRRAGARRAGAAVGRDGGPLRGVRPRPGADRCAAGRRIAHSNADESGRRSRCSPSGSGRDARGRWCRRSRQFDATAVPLRGEHRRLPVAGGGARPGPGLYAEHGAPLDARHEISMLAWCHAAELALLPRDAALGGGAYPRLAPYAGMTACRVRPRHRPGRRLPRDGGRGDRRAPSPPGTPTRAALADAWEVPVVAAWFASCARLRLLTRRPLSRRVGAVSGRDCPVPADQAAACADSALGFGFWTGQVRFWRGGADRDFWGGAVPAPPATPSR